MSNIYEWSAEAASNANIDSAIKWELGQMAKLTNDSARVMMQRVAEYLADLAPKLSTTPIEGTVACYNIASCSQITRPRLGMRFYLVPHADSQGQDNLALNGGKSLPIYKFNALKQQLTKLEPGDFTKGNCYELLYNSQLIVEGSAIAGWFVANLSSEMAGQTAISGTILPFAGLTPPAGWLICDGTMLEIAKYPQLYKIIGKSYGGGDNSDKFALPDLRGVFIRGFDAGKGLDSGHAFASFQDDANKKHSHQITIEETGLHAHRRLALLNPDFSKFMKKRFPKMMYDDPAEIGKGVPVENAGKHVHKIEMQPQGDAGGMRPKNISVNYIIKL